MVPLVEPPARDPAEALLAQRRVMLSGRLDHGTATRIAAELMTLDGLGDEEIELLINSEGGPLAEVLAVLDVIGLLRAPVSTRCVGRAMGTAAVVLACGTRRRTAAPHAVISLRCREPERLEGSADAVRQQLEELQLVRRQVVAALAQATGRTPDELSAQLDEGGVLDRDAAIELGVLDRPSASAGS